jgi:hypothetical protein
MPGFNEEAELSMAELPSNTLTVDLTLDILASKGSVISEPRISWHLQTVSRIFSMYEVGCGSQPVV